MRFDSLFGLEVSAKQLSSFSATSLRLLKQTTMASRKVADHTLYHLSPKGFWKKFREYNAPLQY